jgi:hypothetical protein
MWLLALLAEAGAAEKDPFRKPEVIWGSVAIIVALLLGALVIHFADKWRKQNVASARDTVVELSDFRGMFDRGEITADEYAKLRDKVAKRVKTQTKPPVSPESPAPNSLPPPTDPETPPNPLPPS